uniref:RyR domain-containing protein n=1 Tax=Heterorhabditis bacteriophora TaxID=37862 RepID=A0A1I7XL42_HETBA
MLSEDIRALEEGISHVVLKSGLLGESPSYPSKETEGEDYIDLGAATLDFYSSLVDLLAKCAPDPMAIQAGKGDSLRARAILRSLISLDDLGQILSLRFTIPNLCIPTTDVRRRSFASSHQHKLNLSHSFAMVASELSASQPRKSSVAARLSRLSEEDIDESNYGSANSSITEQTVSTPYEPVISLKGYKNRAVQCEYNLKTDNGPLPGLLPNHKGSVLLFLDRVYGIDSQDMLFHFLEQSFLPDLRAATMMDSPRALESDTALALNRYLCNAVLPLLTNHSHFFSDAEHHSALLDATLHTVYRMNRLKSLTKNQREAVSDFLVAITRELPPGMMIKLLRKVIIDIQQMSDMNVLVPLRALPCLTAIGSAISPDYTLTTGGDDVNKLKESMDDGAWVPKIVDVSRVELSRDIQMMIEAFAEHFHDSWASRKVNHPVTLHLEKGWMYGEFYSRQQLSHPRLKPFNQLKEFFYLKHKYLVVNILQERSFYKERCAECLRALIAWGYSFELADRDAAERAKHAHTPSGTSIQNFCPKPVDLSSMTLEKVLNDLNTKGGFMPIPLVPWDLLTDFERRKDRFRAMEILKFLQYHGYRVDSPRVEQAHVERMKSEGERSSVEKRFAYNLLEKLIQYLEQASLKMKSVKPSQELTRRNSFKKEGQDVKFFEKVVLPLMHAYFNAHKNYFLEGSSIVQTGTASNKEKEMVANLFCRLAALLRIKNRAFGSVAKITVKCLQGLTQALDLRTLVKVNSDIVRTSLLTFFNNCADDLFSAVKELKDNGQYALIRGQNLKSWISLEFAHQMIVPVLTTMFSHLARNHFGTDLLLDDIQAACYKILDSLYMVTGLTSTAAQRKSIGFETDKHRPGLGQCLSAFASCFPVAFLEPEFNKNNKYSVLAKTQDQSVQVSINNVMYGEQPNVYDVDLPLICSYLAYWFSIGPDGRKSDRLDEKDHRHTVQITTVSAEHINRVFCALLRMIRNHVGVENAPWLCRVTCK